MENYAFTTLDFDPATGYFVGVGRHVERGGFVVTPDAADNVLAEIKSDLCDALEPRQFGYERR